MELNREKIVQLYKDVIISEQKVPFNFFKPEKPCQEIKSFNPICGDKYTIYVDNDPQHYRNISFQGIGCALSKASTSILLKHVHGKSDDEVIAIIHQFLQMMDGKIPYHGNDLDLQTLVQLKKFEGRIDCITLSWKYLQEFLTKKVSKI